MLPGFPSPHRAERVEALLRPAPCAKQDGLAGAFARGMAPMSSLVRTHLARRLSPLAARWLRFLGGPLGLATLGSFTGLVLAGVACNEIDAQHRSADGLSAAETKLARRTQWPATLEGQIQLDASEPAPGNDLYVYGTLFTESGEVLVFATDSRLRGWGVTPGDRVRARVRPADEDLVGDDRFYDLLEVEKVEAAPRDVQKVVDQG